MKSYCIAFAASLVLSSSQYAAAQNSPKEEMHAQMRVISAQVEELRANGGDSATIARLIEQYESLRDALGGDDPTALSQPSNGPAEIDPSHPGPLNAATQCCIGPSATATFTDPIGGALPDVATVQFIIPVGGFIDPICDVDLFTTITHTFAADLDITLTSPGGTVMIVTTDNGGGFDDVWNGTLWDDTWALHDPCTDHVYANLVLASPINPEGRLSVYRGENPNGNWILTITDDAGADVGNLANWSLTITTQPPAALNPFVFANMPNLPILDVATVSDGILVAGMNPFLARIKLYVEIVHTFAADLDITLTSPDGKTVTVTTDNGGGFDNVWNGTLFDPHVTDTVTDHVYANLVVATPLSPEGPFDNFIGKDPNGLWTLTITDDAGADVGTLIKWELRLWDWRPSGPIPYCTCGTTTNGCCAVITANNNPSVSLANSCIVTVNAVEGQKSGIMFYGIAGPAMAPWNGSSFLCVKAPVQRTGTQLSGGTANACDGALVLDWNAYQTANPTSLGNPWAVGNKAWLQGWFRDPPAIKTTNLSDGLEMTYQP